MQLRKTNLLLAALCATGLFLTACGDETSDGNALCAQDSECGDNEICSAGFCMQTCDSAADCPDSNKNCVAQSATSTQKVCKCQTDALCQGDSGNTDLKCDASSGACTTTGVTPGPTSCTGTGQATCSYGSECVNSTCTAITTGTCSNITGATEPTSGYKPSTWTPAISNKGPVIFDVAKATYAADSTFCPGTSYRAVARVQAYANTGFTFPANRDGLGNFFYAMVNGTTRPVQGTSACPSGATCVAVTGYSTSNSAAQAQLDVNFCTNDSTLQIGLFFVNGNGYCADIVR